MKLQYPYTAVLITDDDRVAFLHIRTPQDASPHGNPQTFEKSLHTLSDIGLEKAYAMVGEIILSGLSVDYREKWLRFPNLRAFHPEEPELDLISNLTSKLLRSKNQALIPIIDTLIAELLTRAPEMANDSTIETWPDIRASLERHPE